MSDTLKLSGALRLGSLASAPSNPEVGYAYYDSNLSKYRIWDGSSWQEIADFGQLSSTSNAEGASLVSIEDASTQFTSTNVEGALDEALDAAQAAQASVDAHENGGNNKHDASEVDVETAANYTTAADLETNLSALDTQIKANADAIASGSDDQTAAEVAYTQATVGDWTVGQGSSVKATLDEVGGRLEANDAKVSADGNVTTHSDVTNAGSGIIISGAERTKLDGIETAADVTDGTNVAAAGAVMEADTSTASMSFVIDEDNMASDSATKVPTQQSVKAYTDTEVASAIAGGASFKGDYNAATNTPDLDSTPIATAVGDMYVTTVAGTFFSTPLEVGDIIIAKTVNATTEGEWSVVQANLTPATIKSQYESNANTNAFTDAEQTKLAGVDAGAKDDQTGAEIKSAYEGEADTNAYDDAAVSKLGGIEASADVTDATNVASAGAVMESDSTTASMSFVIDEDDMVSDSATKVPTQQSVKAYADTKIADLSEDTTPSLGGDLTLGDNTIIHDGNGMQRGTSASNFLEEEYIHSIALLASQSDTVISDLSFAHASFEGLEMAYKMKEATSNNVRIGTIRVVTNGTAIALNDMSVETASLGVTFSAIVNGANINIRYTSDTNAVTMRADVKRIKA